MKQLWPGNVSPRRRKQILWAAALLLFYTLFGFFILPPIIRSVAVKQAAKALGREVSIQKIKLNPYTLSATVRGVLVKDKDGEPFVSWHEAHANFQLSSIFSGGWDFKEFALKSPFVRVQIGTNGTLNFADLLQTTNAPSGKSEGKTRPLRVESMRLTNVVVAFTDLALRTPFSHQVGIVELKVHRFSTASDINNPYSFSGTTVDGEAFEWKGAFSLDPVRSQGEVSFSGLALRKYAPYYEDKVRFDLRDGVVDTTIRYSVVLGTATNSVRITDASATLKNLAVAAKGSSTNSLQVPLALLSGGQVDLSGRTAALDRFSTRDGWCNFRRLKNGELDLVELLAPKPSSGAGIASSPTSPAGSAEWVARIGDVFVQNYAVSFVDFAPARPVEIEVDRITLNLTNISNQRGTNTQVDLALRWNGMGTISAAGAVELMPPSGRLNLHLAEIGLRPLDHYLDSALNLAINDGIIGLDGVAQFALPTNGPIAASFRGDFRVSDFVSKEIPGGRDFAKWRNLALRGIELRVEPMVATVDQVELDELFFRYSRNGTTNNVVVLFPAAPVSRVPAPSDRPQPPGPPSADASVDPVVNINSLAILKGRIDFEDLANSRPVRLSFDELDLKLKNLSNQPGTNVGVTFSARLNTNGTVRTDGVLSLFPPAADVKLSLDGVVLRPLDPYLDPFANLLITSGALGVDGHARVSVPKGAPVSGAFRGDVRLTDFATVDAVLNEEFVRWRELALRGIDFQLAPMSVSLKEVGVGDLLLRFVLGENTNNVAGLLKKPPAPARAEQPSQPASAAPAAPAVLPKINVAKIALTNANLEFMDRSIKPAAALSVRQLTGLVGDLSSERIGSGTVDIQGRVDNTAPFSIAGSLSLLTREKDSDFKVSFHDVDMNPMGPYIAKYLGYRLTKGRFNVDLAAAIKGRKVDSKNLVVFDQFTLGESVPGTNAIKAPIKLALAILKDREGKIELDLPVQGDLDDPNYRYGRILWRAVGNILVKAATSPFALLGAAFGGKGEELSFQDFDAGEARLKAESTSKLDMLARALENRPALNLEINGSYESSGDADALRAQKLAREFRAQKFAELRAAGQVTLLPEQIELSAIEYTNRVLLAYVTAFPTNLTNTAVLSFAMTNRLAVAPAGAAVTTSAPNSAPAPPRMIRPAEQIRGAGALMARRPDRIESSSAGVPMKTGAELPAVPSASTVTNLALFNSQLPLGDMETALLRRIEVTESDLQLLAAERAKSVKEYLIEKGKIAGERLFITETEAAAVTNRAARVYLQLR